MSEPSDQTREQTGAAGAEPAASLGAAARPSGSGVLSPSDELKMLVELLRPAGAELGRRWLAALLLVPAGERDAVVAAVERRIVEEFCGERGAAGASGERDGSGGEPAAEVVVVKGVRL